MIKEYEDYVPQKCDHNCTARATWRASFLNGPLYFCNHHFTQHSKGNVIQSASLEVTHIPQSR